jgi:L-fucose mutarotase/ribose pyranase (RbsD/FucU family)
VRRVTEVRLSLSLEALQAMSEGDELVFAVDDGGDVTHVLLRCDDMAVESLRDAVQRALLHLLPTSPNVH